MIHFTKTYEDIGVRSPFWQDVRALIVKCKGEVRLGQIEVVIDIPSGIEVFADPLIAKAFYNLMDNSVIHGGKTTTIRFSAEEEGGALSIVCEDDGNGIPAELRPKLFTKVMGNDHGFGLFLSKEILSITGITICEKSEPGHGAKFVMTAPASGFRVSLS